MVNLEGLHQKVEDRCNTPEGLLRLVQALLEHQPKLSDTARDYVAALVYYAFHSRRKAIWNQTGKILRDPHGINSGHGPATDLEIAREEARLREDSLRAELSVEEIQAIKNQVGRLPLRGLLRRILDSNYEVSL